MNKRSLLGIAITMLVLVGCSSANDSMACVDDFGGQEMIRTPQITDEWVVNQHLRIDTEGMSDPENFASFITGASYQDGYITVVEEVNLPVDDWIRHVEAGGAVCN